MKKLLRNKKIIIPIIILILLIVSGLIYYFINSKNDEFVIGETLKITDSNDYLVEYDNGDYYLMKANADIKFNVSSKDEDIKYKIVDENDKEIDSKVSKKKNDYIIASNENYEAGKTYKITLENATFTDEKLKDIKTLYFTIVRPNSNTQELNDNVIKVNADTITLVNKDDNYYTITSTKEFKKDDVLYYQNENEVIAFKVNEIKKEKDNYIIKTNAPTLKELFKELDIYGEFNLKLDDFIANEELKDYIKVSIVKNGLLDNIIPNVQAKDILDVDVKPQKDGSAKVLVSISLNHENKTIFKDTLENHDMKLDVEFTIKLKAHCDITLFKQDIGAGLDIDIKTNFNINPTEATEEFSINYDTDVNDDLNVKVGLFKDILSNTKSDVSKEETNLGKMVIPTPILGLSVDLELDLIKELELVLKADLKYQNNFNILFGYNNKGFYKDFDFSVKNSSYEVLGKAEAKLGINPKVNINFCRVMEAGIEAPLGLYADGQINYMNSSNKDEVDGKMEIGTFISAGLYAETHFIIAKVEATYEKKLPIITLEGKLKNDCEEKVLSGDFSCYTGEYENIDGTKKLTITNDYFTDLLNKNYELEILDNGKICLSPRNAPVPNDYCIIPIGVEYSACDSNDLGSDWSNLQYKDTDINKIRFEHYTSGGVDCMWDKIYYKKSEVIEDQKVGNLDIMDEDDNCEEKVLNGDFSCFVGTYTANNADDPTKTIDKNGINIDYYRMSDGQKDGRSKLKNVKIENGIYYLTYDIGYFIGQQASVYKIVPIGVEYEAVDDRCEKCKSNEDNCRYEASNEEYFGTCYYNTDKNKLRIIGSELGIPIIYYKD